MNGKILARINGYGQVFRFITPILITVAIFLLNWIRTDVKKIDTDLISLATHFTNHLSHHKDLEVDYEHRITIIESKTGVKNVGKDR